MNRRSPVPAAARAHLEVFRKQQLAGAQETKDVAEDVAVPVDEVVLLQTVQHDGLCTAEQPADPAETRAGVTV